ncbi:MAG: hypothetical protein E7812_16220 [Phenylobacterium sp.]|nr:MAG: hypothetical protein E7812_16220 [Phenylobacterium sp.]
MKLLPLAIGAAVLCAASAAQASPAFDAFQKICVAHRGDAAGALAAATAAGWQPVPKAVLGMIPLSDGKMSGLDGRLLSGGSGMMVLLVAHSDQISKTRPIPADICALGVTGDAASLPAEAGAFAEVPATTDPDVKGASVFVWRAGAARHVPVALASLRPEQANHDVSMLAVAAQGPVTLLALTVPTK